MKRIEMRSWTWDTWLRFIALLVIFIIGAPISRLMVPDAQALIYFQFLLIWFPVVAFVLAFWDGLRHGFSLWWIVIPPLLELVTVLIMDGWAWAVLIPVLLLALCSGWGNFFGDRLLQRHQRKEKATREQAALQRAAKRAQRERRSAQMAPRKKRRPH